jgi:hypothetical protein
MTDPTTEYLDRLPESIPPGRVLVHNSVRLTRRLGSRSFRAWLADHPMNEEALFPLMNEVIVPGLDGPT